MADIYYWPPSGDIAIIYDDLGQSIPPPGMVRLGSVDSGLDAIASAGNRFTVWIDRACCTTAQCADCDCTSGNIGETRRLVTRRSEVSVLVSVPEAGPRAPEVPPPFHHQPSPAQDSKGEASARRHGSLATIKHWTRS